MKRGGQKGSQQHFGDILLLCVMSSSNQGCSQDFPNRGLSLARKGLRSPSRGQIVNSYEPTFGNDLSHLNFSSMGGGLASAMIINHIATG